MGGTSNRRVAAALQYFHSASRLIVSGQSDWESMAEAVLNMCKSMQVLFGNRKDDIRRGLRELGYEQEEIEGDFIPIVELRNHFDVGHPRLALFQRRGLDVLYQYLLQSEDNIRALLTRVVTGVCEGTFELPEDDLTPTRETERRFRKLVTRMGSRLVPSKKGQIAIRLQHGSAQ